MWKANVTMTARQASEAVSIVDIQGEVTAMAESVLMAAHDQTTGWNARAIILNFSGLEYMNSGGIGLLLKLFIRANRQQQQLLICGLSEQYRKVFDLTRLDEAAGIYGTEAEALAAVDGEGNDHSKL
jgi:anti-sigma B factor antagonist